MNLAEVNHRSKELKLCFQV